MTNSHPNFNPWMKKLPDNKMLHQLSIPGTHDSGTSNLSAISRCQSLTLEEQLFAGIRYFDIRLNADDMQVVHGPAFGSGSTGIWFSDVAELFRKFLAGEDTPLSSNETIIMQVKDDRGTTNDLHTNVINVLKDVFANHLDKLYLKPIRCYNGNTFTDIPTLKDLRGKLVLIRRYDLDTSEEDDEAGTPVKYFAWGDNYNNWSTGNHQSNWLQTFTNQHFDWPDGEKGKPGDNNNVAKNNGKPTNSLIDYRNRHGLSFVVQDKYNITGLGTDIYAEKVKLVKEYLNDASQGKSPDSWFLNFSSCTENMEHPVDYANKINPELKAYFQASPPRNNNCGFGTILMDFVDQELINLIINQN